MEYKVDDKIYSKTFKKNIVILKVNEDSNTYIGCFEGESNSEKHFRLTEKNIDLIKVGYIYSQGTMLKFNTIYGNFEAIYCKDVNGSGCRVDLTKDYYEILTDNQIEEFKHFEFRQRVLDIYGIEKDEPLYRISDVVKFIYGEEECIGEIYDSTDVFLFIKCCDKLYPISRDEVLQWYPKDNLLDMRGHNYYECVENDLRGCD